MALGTTLRTRTAARPPAPPTAELTIEEARKQYPVGSLNLVVAEIKEQERLAEEAKGYANGVNRQGTKVKNAFKSYALANELTADDQVLIGDSAYRYDVNYSEKYDVEGLLKMHKEGKITDGEFLRSISVNKAEAEKAIGPHKLFSLLKVTAGKTMDLRRDTLDEPVKTPTLVRGKKLKLEPKLRTASQEAPPKKTLTSKPKLVIKRKLKVR